MATYEDLGRAQILKEVLGIFIDAAVDIRCHEYSKKNRLGKTLRDDLMGLVEELNETQKEAIGLLRLSGVGYPSRKSEDKLTANFYREFIDVLIYMMNILERDQGFGQNYNSQFRELADSYIRDKFERYENLLEKSKIISGG